MAVRLRRGGTTDLRDHNELLNRGVRTHTEIDSYLDEIDLARGLEADLAARFNSIEKTVTDNEAAKDAEITALIQKDSAHDSTLGQIEQRLEELESSSPVIQEVIDARTDLHGITHGNLQTYLHEIQEKAEAARTGGGSNYLLEYFRVSDSSTFTLQSGQYSIGNYELEVFYNGIRLRRNEFAEINSTTVRIDYPITEGGIVVFRVRDRLGSNTPIATTPEHVEVTSAISTFNVTTEFTRTGQTLEVYYNGILQALGEDYNISGQSVSFTFTPEIGSSILFLVTDKNRSNVPKLLEEALILQPPRTVYQLQTFSYVVGASELELYLNGVRLTHLVDYKELDESNFELLFVPNGTSTLVAVKENGISSVVNPSPPSVDTPPPVDSETPKLDYLVTTPEGQEMDTFQLPSEYSMGENELLVFLNGMAVQYQEIDSTTIKLPVKAYGGDQVYVHRPAKTVVRLDALLSLKQTGITVGANTNRLISVDILSSAVDLRYIRFASSQSMNAVFEVVESPSDSVGLLAYNQLSGSRIVFNGSQPYTDDLSSKRLYIRITNRDSSSLSFDLCVKYVMYASSM